ncbi:MAG: hypothetical protein IJ105_03740 [Bacilli bacterium]|nr:hypothetical protein [Bacilli bacterium]
MDNYYLQINLIDKNNKKAIVNYQLYNYNKLIYEYNDNDVKKINKIIKDYKRNNRLDIIKNDSNYRIYDIDFLKKYIGIPSKKVNHINKNIKKIAFLTTLSVTFLSTSLIDHKVNPDLYNKTNIENNIDNEENNDLDFVYVDNNINEIKKEKQEKKEAEELFDEIDTTMMYTEKTNTNPDNYKIIFYSDKDDKVEESVLQTEIVSSSNDIYKFLYNYEDRSNNEYIQKIIDSYSNSIRHCSEKYGIDEKLIIAMICQENPKSDINYTDVGGVGLLQVERQIWNNYTMNDIDGNLVTINCDEINNISSDYEKMSKVAIYKNDLKNSIINENDYVKYGINQDDIKKFENAEKSIEIGCMIFEYCENQILENNNKNAYNYKLTDEECELLSIWAHNKGINQVENCLKNTYSFDETLNLIKQTPYGDNEYLEHVVSYLPNDTNIIMKTRNNENIVINIKNNSENYSKSM